MPTDKKIVAQCRSCGCELRARTQTDGRKHLKQKRWSNVEGVQEPFSGVCRRCGNKGNR